MALSWAIFNWISLAPALFVVCLASRKADLPTIGAVAQEEQR